MAKGVKTGGRKKGSRNRKVKEEIEALAASGLMPLDYMLAIVRDLTVDPVRRDDMSKAAAPYCHAKLASIEHTGKDGADLIPRIINVKFPSPS